MKTSAFIAFGLLALVQGKSVQYTSIESRVVNGEDAEPGQFPYQVSLQSGYHFCGGSIVNEQWVVTAAHCVNGNSPALIKVIIGTVSLKNPHKAHKAEKIIVHEKYTPGDSHRNDIALIKVVDPFVFSDSVKPVSLPEPNIKVKTNSSAVLSGWGGLKNSWSPTPDILQFAKLYVADPEYCQKVMQEINENIYSTHLCANDPSERRGQCNGDSGGPLVIDGELNGIVSWSYKDPDCASTKYPGVYTRVSEYVEWILEHVN